MLSSAAGSPLQDSRTFFPFFFRRRNSEDSPKSLHPNSAKIPEYSLAQTAISITKQDLSV